MSALTSPLTIDEGTAYDELIDELMTVPSCLVRSTFDGEPVGVVCSMYLDADDERNYVLQPLAIVLTDELRARLVDPTTEDAA